jgi:iron complex outermembrane receptor protein
MTFDSQASFALWPVIALIAGLGTAQAADSDPQGMAATAQGAAVVPQEPDARTTLSSAELEARGITSIDGIAAATPFISSAPAINSANTPILYMRGQGLDNPGQITRDGAIGVYQDGFLISRAEALAFDLGEMARVDVLRGPQGARYGRDTTGGVINLVTRAPTGEFAFKQSVDFGNRDMFRILSSVDAPRWHGIEAKATLLISSIDGYVKNLGSGLRDYGQESQRGGRLQLRYDGLDTLRVDYFLEKSDLDSTPAYDTNPALNGATIYFIFPYYANPSGPTRTTYRGINLPLSTSKHTAQGLTLTWTPADAFVAKLLTGYRTLGADANQDYAEFAGFSELTDDLYTHRQFSQELQLSGKLLDEQLRYHAGVSYFKESGEHVKVLALPSQGDAVENRVEADGRSEAAFAELQWSPAILGKRLSLTAAARYTRDNKAAERFLSDANAGPLEEGAASGAVNHLEYHRFDPAFTVNYEWNDAISTYARISTGYRAAGAVEQAPVGQFNSASFRPESLSTAEIGLKSAWLDGRMRADVAAFDSRYKDIQYAVPLDAITDEAYDLQRATIRGVELELFAAPVKDLALSASVAYLNWTIDRVDVLAGSVFDPASGSGSPYALGDNIRSLFALPFAPKYNFTLGADYTLLHLDRREVTLHLDYAYRGGMYSNAAAGPGVPGRQFDTMPAFGLLNGRITMAEDTDWSHHVKLSLWGKNILNRKYFQIAGGVGSGASAFTAPSSGAATPSGYTSTAGAWSEPATFGVNIIYEY